MNFRQPAGVIAGREVFSHTRGVEPPHSQPGHRGRPFSHTRGVEPKCTVPTEKKIGWGTLACHAVALAVFGVLVATGVLA